jgi:hypothetical protein
VGCVVVAVSLPGESVVGGLVLLAAGIVVWLVRRRFTGRGRRGMSR